MRSKCKGHVSSFAWATGNFYEGLPLSWETIDWLLAEKKIREPDGGLRAQWAEYLQPTKTFLATLLINQPGEHGIFPGDGPEKDLRMKVEKLKISVEDHPREKIKWGAALELDKTEVQPRSLHR